MYERKYPAMNGRATRKNGVRATLLFFRRLKTPEVEAVPGRADDELVHARPSGQGGDEEERAAKVLRLQHAAALLRRRRHRPLLEDRRRHFPGQHRSAADAV